MHTINQLLNVTYLCDIKCLNISFRILVQIPCAIWLNKFIILKYKVVAKLFNVVK